MTDLVFLGYIFFLVFFAVVLNLFKDLNRTIVVFLLNCLLFYCFNTLYLGVLLVQALFTYLLCLSNYIQNRLFFILGLFLNLGPLVATKYLEVSFDSRFVVIGISFYTLQLIGYLLDVRWGRIRPEKSFSQFFAYVIFFGNFISGPIERAGGFLSQLHRDFKLSQTIMVHSFMYIFLGLIKKYILAGNLSPYIMTFFQKPELYGGLSALLPILLSKFFMYYSLSGYSDIVVGISKMYGFDLTRNFERPLFALRINDFWKRWHISMSTWIRDYIFFPLLSTPLVVGGVGFLLILTFLFFGLWHGFKLTFIFYGLLQALFLIGSPLYERFSSRIPSKFFRWIFFYIIFLTIPSTLFFSDSISQFSEILQAPFRTSASDLSHFFTLGRVSLPLLLAFLICFEIMNFKFISFDWLSWFMAKSYPLKHFIVLLSLLIFLALAKIDAKVGFQYWDF